MMYVKKEIQGVGAEEVCTLLDVLEGSNYFYILRGSQSTESLANDVVKGYVNLHISVDHETDHFGTLPVEKNFYGDWEYTISFQALLEGINNALNGNFKHENEDEVEDGERAAKRFINDERDGMFDVYEAETLWNIIIFNEIIYG
jgi:hypothetical protein